MTKIDLKDLKILFHLYKNSRESYSNIGKKVGLHRNNVKYRVDKLIDTGIITKSYAVVNTFRLGYGVIRIYLKFQNIDEEIKKKIIDYFVKYEHSWFVVSTSGEFDLATAIWIKDRRLFHAFWDEMLKRYRNYIQKHVIAVFLSLIYYI